MKIARIVAMLLLIAMCMAMVVACNDNSGGEVTTVATTKPSSGTTTPTEDLDERGYLKDKVEDANYGKTINIRCWTQSTKEYDLPEPGDDADDIDYALYNRNRKVEDRLGVELKYHDIAGGSSSVNAFVDDVHNTVSTGLGSYDIVGAYIRCAGALALKGDYVNLYDIDNVYTEMPWWPAEIINTNTVADKLFTATGDIATSLIYNMEFMIINQDLAETRGLDVDEIQALAVDGKWTFDYMLSIAKGVWEESDDVDGQSKGDTFGLVVTGHAYYDMFYMGAGLKYVEPNEDDTTLVLSPTYYGQVSKDILQKFADAYTTDNSFWYGGVSKAEGKYLLCAVLGTELAGTLRDATFTYRILPAPKYFEEEEYYTAIQFPHSMYSIPKDAKDRSISGAVYEVMASESYRQVTPVLFDKVFLYKLTSCETDIVILNIIRDRSTFDVGRTFFEELGADTNSQVRLWRNLVVGHSVKITQHVNGNMTRWNKTLGGIYDTFASIEN